MRLSLIVTLLLLRAPPLTELDALKAENHKLKVQILQLQEQLAAAQIALQTRTLTDDQIALEAQFRASLHPPEHYIWSWERLEFVAPK